MSSINAHVLPQFNGDNYEFWCIKFRAVLRGLDLWKVVDQGVPHIQQRTQQPQHTFPADTATSTETPVTPTIRGGEASTSESLTSRGATERGGAGRLLSAAELNEWERKDGEALSKIFNAVGEMVFPRIMNAITSKEAWDILKAEYEGTKQDKVLRLQALRRGFENMKMKEGESLQSYTSRFFELTNQMKGLGDNLPSQRLVEKLLVSLTEKFDSIVGIIEQTRDLSTVSPLEVVGALQAQEYRYSTRAETANEGALQVKHLGKQTYRFPNKREKGDQGIPERKFAGKKKFPPCGICGKNNHSEKKCWKKGKPKCTHCHKFGHNEHECRLKKGKAEEEQQLSNLVSTDLPEEFLFMASAYHSSNKSGNWIIDSGCTSHMSMNSSIFQSLDKNIQIPVKMANGESVLSKGKGSIKIRTQHNEIVLHEVLFVPQLEHNLISVSQLLTEGFKLTFEGSLCNILDNSGKVIAEVEMRNKCFMINWQHNIESSRTANAIESTRLWHMRMGHCNSQTLQTLSKSMLVRNIPELGEFKEVCEGCQRGKLNRLPFPKHAAWRAKDKLELVYTDICGPMKTESMEGSRYFLIFIDDCTRMTFVYFLREKSATYDTFLSFKKRVEGEVDQKIKCLRSDNGKEYTSNNFSKFLSDQGVRHQLTAVYSPQQNGVCERKNRTLMEMARTLLYTKQLPLKFWAEAVNTATYLQNRLPTKALDKTTPYEAWKGIKPTVGHLRVFGCLCYHHIPKQRRTKLDAKAGKAILIGYSSQAKAYRLYSLDTHQVVISRDVIFDELNSWDWKEDKAEGTSDSLLEYSVNQNQSPSASVELPSTEPESPYNPSNSPRNNILLNTPLTTHNAVDSSTSQDSTPQRLRNITSLYRRFPRLENCNHVKSDPRTFEEAEPEDHWKAAMQEEINMIRKNETWELCTLPNNRKPIGVKWIFKTKLNLDGSINKHKARLVAKGFLQQSAVDYGETFAPVSRMDTVRTILALAATKGWTVWQLDVKSAFLNGKLKEEIFIEQPEGFVEPGEEHKVLRLHKALYGLKQAPRAWYDKLDGYFKSSNFDRSLSEHTLYTKKDSNNNLAIISVYVDDLIVTGGATKLITEIKKNLMSTFEMTDLGKLHHFLGLEVHQLASGIFVNQEQYAKDILTKFGMINCKEVSTPMLTGTKLSSSNESGAADSREYRSLIGSLLYLAATRPDITHVVCLLSRFMQNPTLEHLVSVKRVLRYVKGTTDHGLWYGKENESKVVGYTDSDWGGSPDDSRSTSGNVFMIGTGAISWGSHKQATVAQSTAEAEYIACCEAVNQAIWLKRIMMDLGEPNQGPAVIYCDNKSAIAIANNPVHHKRTKHIMIKFHFVREMLTAGEIILKHCAGEKQLADLFTKALPVARFDTLVKELGVCGSSIKEEKCCLMQPPHLPLLHPSAASRSAEDSAASMEKPTTFPSITGKQPTKKKE